MEGVFLGLKKKYILLNLRHNNTFGPLHLSNYSKFLHPPNFRNKLTTNPLVCKKDLVVIALKTV